MGYEQPHHRNSSPTCCFVCWPLVLILCKNNGDSDVANAHSDGSKCKNRFSSELVNVQDGRNGGEEHDNTDDTGGKEGSRVGRQTK